MGTKNNPSKFDCYANAHPDEPMFVLLGRDPFAADLVEEWARRRAFRDEATGVASSLTGPSAKAREAFAVAEAMRAYVLPSAAAGASLSVPLAPSMIAAMTPEDRSRFTAAAAPTYPMGVAVTTLTTPNVIIPTTGAAPAVPLVGEAPPR